MFSEFGKFLIEGGIPVYMLLFMGAFGIAVSVERFQSLFFKLTTKTEKFTEQIRTLVVSDKIEEAIAFCASQGTALLPKVVKSILERADRDDESIKNAHEIATMEVIPQVTKGLGYLAMIANVATLVGLLGTIHGLITSFQALSFADPSQKQTLLAQGISLSMNTTALGLVVAIPIMIVYSVLQARQNKLIETLVSDSAKVVDLLVSRNYHAVDESSAFTSAPPKAANGMPKKKAA